MCGIVGQLSFDNNPVSPVVLKKMTDIIRHRGPDGKVIGLMIMLDLVTEDYQIIDLSPAGRQPMVSIL